MKISLEDYREAVPRARLRLTFARRELERNTEERLARKLQDAATRAENDIAFATAAFERASKRWSTIFFDEAQH